MEQTPTPLGRRVRRLRNSLDLTQADLARKAGLSRLSIHYLESGRHRTVRSDNLLRLSRALGVTSEELLGGAK